MNNSGVVKVCPTHDSVGCGCQPSSGEAVAYQFREYDELDGWSLWRELDPRHVEILRDRVNMEIRELYTHPSHAADGEVERLREEVARLRGLFKASVDLEMDSLARKCDELCEQLNEKQKYIDQLECAINVLTK